MRDAMKPNLRKRGTALAVKCPRVAVRRRRRLGAAAVEFAVVAPVFFLFIVGIIDIGRAVMVQNLLAHAARDGARTATLDGASVEGIQASVKQTMQGVAITGITVDVDPNPLESADIGDPVKVTVSVPYDAVSWLPVSKFLNGATLSTSVTMRRETSSATTEITP